MYLVPSARRDYLLLLVANVFLLTLIAAQVASVLSGDTLFHLDRLGRAGPLGLALVLGSLLLAWVELLVVPTLNARAELRRGAAANR
jgi:hypothetical protein